MASLFKGFINLVSVLLLVYLTYFFTMFFAAPRPEAPAPSGAEKDLARKGQELREQDSKLLSSYGWVNPAAKSVRIPVQRAMELVAAESARPIPTAVPGAAAPTPSPEPSPVATVSAPPVVSATAPRAPGPVTVAPSTTTPVTTAPSASPPTAVTSVAAPPPPRRVGMSPEQVYSMVCAACHEPDGRGTIARKTMKDAEQIPDLTDAKWQASRTDADLEHSILEGKGKIMLARKDILGLAHLDVKEMVALMRRFKGGKQVVTGAPTGQPLAAAPPQVAAVPTTVPPVSSVVAPTAPAPQPTPLAGSGPRSSTTPSEVVSPPSLTGSTVALAPTPGVPRPAIGAGPAAPTLAPPGLATPPVGPSQVTAGPGTSLPPALPISVAPSPEQAAKLRVASDFFRSNCFACHGLDGTGNLVRPLMPTIPDFTSRQWQTSRSTSQLQTSILEGKGTLMPPWMGKLSPDFVRDLISYVRTFGPADLLAAATVPGTQYAQFEARLRELRSQRDEVERQLRELDRQPTIR
jgi:mono/diheme cytochrome c family protein